MTAVERLLGTYELLEEILALLRPQDFPAVSRVCTRWRKLVHGSKRIKMARCLTPTEYHCLALQTMQYPTSPDCAPRYAYAKRIRANPLFREANALHLVVPHTLLDDLAVGRPAVEKSRAEYLTVPPITTILLYYVGLHSEPGPRGMLHSGVKCSLQNLEGIKVADFVDTARALLASQTRHRPPARSEESRDVVVLGRSGFGIW